MVQRGFRGHPTLFLLQYCNIATRKRSKSRDGETASQLLNSLGGICTAGYTVPCNCLPLFILRSLAVSSVSPLSLPWCSKSHRHGNTLAELHRHRCFSILIYQGTISFSRLLSRPDQLADDKLVHGICPSALLVEKLLQQRSGKRVLKLSNQICSFSVLCGWRQYQA